MFDTTPSDYLLNTSKEYSLYVCENRAIPKVTDGLKDGQRKALWLMRSRSEKIKTISLAGTMISSNLYLHGDSSAADTISRLAAPFLNNKPLLSGIGNFGTRIAPVEGISAPRYTYVKKNAFLDRVMFADLDLVPLKDNYDGSVQEPVTFLPLIPTVLLNGVSGIAVGWSTEILPRKLSDLIRITKKAIKGERFQQPKPCYEYLQTTVKHVEGNSWEFQGKVEIVDHNTVRIVELPPDLGLEKFRDRLDSMQEEGKIVDYDDNSTKIIDLEVKLKRGTTKDWTEDYAIEFFKLKSRKNERIVVIDWNFSSIRQYEDVSQLIQDFVEWRFGKYVERYEAWLKTTNDDLKFWQAVLKCFEEELPKQLLGFSTKTDLKNAILQIENTLSDNEVERIANFASYRWTREYKKEIQDKIKNLKSLQKEYKSYLKDPEKIKDIYVSELEAVEKL